MVEINTFIKILMFVLSLCIKLTSISAAEFRCVERERQALLKFKHGIVDDYANLSSWGSEEVKREGCKWKGISCRNTTGRVVSLDLSSYGLKAKLSPALLELQHLNYLDLSANDFGGSEIPRFFGSFKKLRYLKLSYSNFSGEVPCELGNLTNLHTLDLRGFNNLKIKNLEWLSHLSLLSYLDLSGVNLINQTSWLHHIITRIPSLKELYLSNCQLPNAMPSFDIFPNSSLSHLDLSKNNLTSSFAFHWLFNFSASLTSIDLSDNQLEGPIPDVFGELIFLEELSLRRNKFHGRIPKSLGNLTHLHSLDMSGNELNGPLPDISKLSSLRDLNLRNNNRWMNVSGLVYLDLANNKFSGKIPLSFGTLDTLQTLNLQGNNFIGELPSTLRNCTQLRILDVGRNKLTGKIPLTLGTLDQLRVLRLRDNNFFGELPSTLSNCTSLRILDVGRNKLKGNIPGWIGTHLTSLSVLSLRFNEFDGIMPSTICRLTDILVLDLSGNNISGRIPRCVNNLTALVQQDSSKEYGNSDDNAFVQWKGHEIEYISVLSTLKFIDLSSNKLVGTIPQEFSVLKGLESLNLSRNYLTGNIISNIGQMKTLECLDLSRNQLSGEIPNSLTDLNFLSVLDLSYNNLTGKIPLGTQLQGFNSSVYVGNSQLCGEPLVKCSRDISNDYLTDYRNKNIFEDDDGFITRDFYICMTFGFITGFWAVVATLILKHSWRHSYFNW